MLRKIRLPIAINSAKYQYSERDANPEKVEYFPRHVLIAVGKFTFASNLSSNLRYRRIFFTLHLTMLNAQSFGTGMGHPSTRNSLVELGDFEPKNPGPLV